MFKKNKTPKVKITSGFINKQGLFRCAGALSALPFNPHPYETCPTFLVEFNDTWIEVQIDECSEDYGWIATAIPTWEEAYIDATPSVDVRKR